MATLEELYGLWHHSVLENKVRAACVIAAETVMNELVTVDNHANRLVWAKAVFANPDGEAGRMYKAVLAANKDATVEVIQAAPDTAIQTNVDDHVDLFADGS